ncbi:DUF1104 domain-containing protein [Sulfurospirillum multivorans]|uniref:Periplasmic binding protein n=2 Tax=Sulfurospirillum multivorans TaxID=66821 RepID=A0AA86AKV2_SULMK|nr:DUF1104 domain-containing protein [Sulfurospirillum multivorans]AHJ11437.1 putative periplasmic binding protein [Sulfurospirillum multivorans DSM 12446]QEH04941.1 putative periplasmic binding protein [Sulfurospirillum multivorans]
MKKILFLVLCTLSFLFAKTDFSEMSTEELVALMGYVDKTKEERFYEELERRTQQMSEAQKALYEEDKRRRDHAQN